MSKVIQNLVAELRVYDTAYYNDGTSPVSDKTYDQKKDLLRKLSPNEPYLQEVAHEAIVTEWEKAKHKYPLGSLTKCNTLTEFKNWWNGEPIILEHKLDGISIALTYNEGKLISAVTRGDGETGDDITQNVRKMHNIPAEIPFKDSIVVRAEILLKHSEWAKMPLESRGKNPRNTAAGAAKELTGSKCKYLDVIAYSILSSIDKNEIDDLQKLQRFGFRVVVYNDLKTIDQIEHYYNFYMEQRDSIDYDFDGLVIKPSIKKKDEWKYPKYQIAWKFPHQTGRTILREVILQVSGDRVTPVAVFDPVDVAGVTISRASLHNYEYIENLKIRIGDEIEITRRNDVIPQVERVIKSNGGAKILVPDTCPCCGGKVTYDTNVNSDEMAWLVCINQSCSAKVSRNVMKWLEVNNTKGIAEKTVELLFEKQIFTDLGSFINLAHPTIEQERSILMIEGMGDSKFDTLKEQIANTLKCDLITFFGGLNIPGFGRRMWERIIKYIQIERDTVCVSDVIGFVTGNELKHVEGFAETNIKEIKKYVNDHLEHILDIMDIVKPQEYSKPSLTSETLKGKSFCFTGELTAMGRKEAQDAVLRNGGDVKSSVTKGLTYLVTNDPNSGSSKNKKAQQVGTSIIGEEEFLKLIK